ncbi:MAG: hypothetical protein ACE5EC_02225, partial [Phycisphaerae bacterium]
DLSPATDANNHNPATKPSSQQRPTNASTLPDTKTRKDWIIRARFAAASVLAGDDLHDYKGCIALLEKLPAGARVLGLHIRCLRGLGEVKEANRVMEEFLKQEAGGELGPVLVGLAAEMESEIDRLVRIGRRREAGRMALQTIPTIRHLLDWIRSQPEHAEHVPIVRFSLINTLIRAGRREEAVGELDELIAAHPNNGVYVRTAARLQEDIATRSGPAIRAKALDRAETLWAMLLRDSKLVEAAPAEYWEARYHWLKHQLRHGRNTEVVMGIRSEQAWRPDLGGPPWQGRILELMEQARQSTESAEP